MNLVSGYQAIRAVARHAAELELDPAVLMFEDSDGSLDIEWDMGRDAVLSISVTESGGVAWAGIVDEQRGHGASLDSALDMMTKLRRYTEGRAL